MRLSHVTLRYDGATTPALDDLSLCVAPGERVCVLGANGSGKSTLAQVVAGLLAPDEGDVELVGRDCCRDGRVDLAAYQDARRELGLVFQNPDDQIVTTVVEDDVAFGPENLCVPGDQIRRRVDRELRRVALQSLALADPTRLSGGQRQRVTIAGALAMEPRVMVLDEPAAMLDVRSREALVRVMSRMAASGCAVLHVTHFMDEALGADRVLVMDHGRAAMLGTPEEVFSAGPEALLSLGLELPFATRVSAALGLGCVSDVDALARQLRGCGPLPRGCQDADAADGPLAGGCPGCQDADAASTPLAVGCRDDHASAENGDDRESGDNRADLAIDARDLRFSYDGASPALDGASLAVPAGSTCAIVGQTGSGKSTLLRIACGLEAPDSGTLRVDGIDASERRGRRAVRHSCGLLMQQSERQLFAPTVAEDVSFGPRNLGLDAAEVERRCTRALELVGLSDRRDASPFSLSGGQMRLCALAGVLAMEPRVLLLDEPMAGLDPRGRRMLRGVLARLSAQGTTIVEVTHSMDEAARADRVVVLDRSRVVACGTPEQVLSADHADALAAAGLGLPRPLALARALRERGVRVAGEPLTAEALVDALRPTVAANAADPAALAAAAATPDAATAATAAPTAAATPTPADDRPEGGDAHGAQD